MPSTQARYRRDAQRDGTPRGWDPTEPTLIGIALAFLIIATVFPWWGIEETTFFRDRPLIIRESAEFGPWVTTHWLNAASVGIYSRATPFLWWDFSRAHPEFSAYTSISGPVTILWSAALGPAIFALLARAWPRSRMGGWPTVAQAMAAILAAGAIAVAVFGFPAAGGLGAFVGASDDPVLAWGPRVGWYAVLFATAALIISTFIGLHVDRRLKGLCWSCQRTVSGARCDFCGATQ